MFLLQDNITNGFEINVLNILSIISVYCGILVITTKNPIVSVLFLITLFLNIACYLILLGLNFIGLSYLLVYVGAVSILFLFILMLINIRISELVSQTRNSIPLVIIAYILVYKVIDNILPTIDNNNVLNLYYNKKINDSSNLNNNINYTSTFSWDGNITELNPMASMGNIMFTSYPIRKAIRLRT